LPIRVEAEHPDLLKGRASLAWKKRIEIGEDMVKAGEDAETAGFGT